MEFAQEGRKGTIVFATAVTALIAGMSAVLNLGAPQMPAPFDSPIPAVIEEKEDNPFEEFYYYNEANQKRYVAYQNRYPHLKPDEVVWRVNADIDQPLYTNVKVVKNPDQVPVVVNKHRKLPDGYVPANLSTLPSGKPATKATCIAYRQMAADARKQGISMYAASAYRPYSTQKRIYNNYIRQEGGNVAKVDTYSARPGHSEHQTGRTIDLIGSFGSLNDFIRTPAGPWVRDNCYKYGFIVRYQQATVPLTGYKAEPWHITYVGKDVSTAMHKLGIKTLEEYAVKYIDYKPPTGV